MFYFNHTLPALWSIFSADGTNNYNCVAKATMPQHLGLSPYLWRLQLQS